MSCVIRVRACVCTCILIRNAATEKKLEEEECRMYFLPVSCLPADKLLSPILFFLSTTSPLSLVHLAAWYIRAEKKREEEVLRYLLLLLLLLFLLLVQRRRGREVSFVRCILCSN